MPGWTVLVPVKRLDGAKTRLRPAANATRRDLALAFALDTMHAAARCPAAGRVLAVTGDPAVRKAAAAAGLGTVDEGPRPDLNAALRHAAALLREAEPDVPLAALTADLPALRPVELAAALEAARKVPRAFVPDAIGTGTVLLTAAPGSDLDPHFGDESAAAHLASGAKLLPGLWPSLRRDVDTAADLAAAGYLGLGGFTRALYLSGVACNVPVHAGNRRHLRRRDPDRYRPPRRRHARPLRGRRLRRVRVAAAAPGAARAPRPGR